MKTGIKRIADERKRQIEVEGYTPEHDMKNHDWEELMDAALAYLLLAQGNTCAARNAWPWGDYFFKENTPPARCLEKAGALLAASLDRRNGK